MKTINDMKRSANLIGKYAGMPKSSGLSRSRGSNAPGRILANATRRQTNTANEDISLQPLVTTFEKGVSDGAGKNARSEQDDFSDLFSANQTGMGAGPNSLGLTRLLTILIRRSLTWRT
jgi:hypothetical protein